MRPSPRHRTEDLAARVRRGRIAAWRLRHAVTLALALALAWWVAGRLAPADDGAPVVVLSAAVQAGDVVREDAVRLVNVPARAAPADAIGAIAQIVDAPALIALSPGTVLTSAMLAGPDLADHLPAGQVAVPVTFADRGSRSIAGVGREVLLYAGAGEVPAQVGSRARILAVFEPTEASMLGAGDDETDVLVAVPAGDAQDLLAAAVEGPIRAILPGR